MKKIILILLLFIFTLPVYSQSNLTDEDIQTLTNLGFLGKKVEKRTTPNYAIRNLFKLHEKYTNDKNITGLSSLYADKYISFDGFNKSIYMKLADKTWKAYKDIKYKCKIKSIILVDEKEALVEVEESISGLSYVGKKYIKDGYGLLDNISKCIYIVENINGNWQIVSDNIYFEQTMLTYGSAKYIPWYLTSPSQINSNQEYTIGLHVLPPNGSIIIASLGKENVTYPQKSAEEIFRKVPESHILERVVKSNNKNLNEYAVSFFVVMNANEEKDLDIFRMQVTGVGLAMNRVNVVPRNKYIKDNDEKKQEHK
jgi:hypothetical protein